jgi:hypothetical protein
LFNCVRARRTGPHARAVLLEPRNRTKKKAPTSGAQVKEETPMIRREQRYLICPRCQWENSVATLHLKRV